MINVYNSTPKVYYDNSRDFQLFGRIYEVLFNYIQSNVSQVTEYEINSSLIDLLLYTLGFNKDLNYSSLIYVICAALPKNSNFPKYGGRHK